MISSATEAALYLISQRRKLSEIDERLDLAAIKISFLGLIHKEQVPDHRFKTVRDLIKGRRVFFLNHPASLTYETQKYALIHYYLAHTPFPQLTAKRLGVWEDEPLRCFRTKFTRESQAMIQFLHTLGSGKGAILQLSNRVWIEREVQMNRNGALIHDGKRISWAEAFRAWGEELGGTALEYVRDVMQKSLVEPILRDEVPSAIKEIEFTVRPTHFTSTFAEWVVEKTLIALSSCLGLDITKLSCAHDIKTFFLRDEMGRQAILYFSHKRELDLKIVADQSAEIKHLAYVIGYFLQLRRGIEADILFLTLYQVENGNYLTDQLPFLTELSLRRLADNDPELDLRIKMVQLLSKFSRPQLMTQLIGFLAISSYRDMLSLTESINPSLLEERIVERFLYLTELIKPQQKLIWIKQLLFHQEHQLPLNFVSALLAHNPDSCTEELMLWLADFIFINDIDNFDIFDGLSYLQERYGLKDLPLRERLAFMLLIRKRGGVSNTLLYVIHYFNKLSQGSFQYDEELLLKTSLKFVEHESTFALATIKLIRKLTPDRRCSGPQWMQIYLDLPRPQVPYQDTSLIEPILRSLHDSAPPH